MPSFQMHFIQDCTGHQPALGITRCHVPDVHSVSSSRSVGTAFYRDSVFLKCAALA